MNILIGQDWDIERHSALRYRPTGAIERLKSDLEGLSPAQLDGADGLGEVLKYYPQPAGTRPEFIDDVENHVLWAWSEFNGFAS